MHDGHLPVISRFGISPIKYSVPTHTVLPLTSSIGMRLMCGQCALFSAAKSACMKRHAWPLPSKYGGGSNMGRLSRSSMHVASPVESYPLASQVVEHESRMVSQMYLRTPSVFNAEPK